MQQTLTQGRSRYKEKAQVNLVESNNSFQQWRQRMGPQKIVARRLGLHWMASS